MTKSGLFVHFGSKAQLERAVVEGAHTIFFNRVLLPCQDLTPGIERVWRLCDYWLVKANTGAQVAGGVNGFKVVGMVLGLAVHSRALGYTMGAYGAGMSLYSHFIARGNEVVFPKNTAMEIGIGTRKEAKQTSRVMFGEPLDGCGLRLSSNRQ